MHIELADFYFEELENFRQNATFKLQKLQATTQCALRWQWILLTQKHWVSCWSARKMKLQSIFNGHRAPFINTAAWSTQRILLIAVQTFGNGTVKRNFHLRDFGFFSMLLWVFSAVPQTKAITEPTVFVLFPASGAMFCNDNSLRCSVSLPSMFVQRCRVGSWCW